MAKWQFSRAGSWDYPTLGFSASFGDVIEADLAPDAYWDAVDAGTPVTIPVTPSAGAVEDPDGGMLVYDAASNRYVAKTPAQARAALSVLSETEQDARYGARTITAQLPVGGSPDTGGSVALNRGFRIPVVLPVTTTRWRIRHANLRPNTGQAGTSTMTVPGVALGGAPIRDTSAPYNITGALAVAPTPVIAGYTVPTDGSDYVSEWVEGEADQFTAGEMRLLSTGVVTLADGTTYYQGTGQMHVLYRNNSSGDWDDANPGTWSWVAAIIGDLRLEIEVAAHAGERVQLFMGDSLTAGVGDGDQSSSPRKCSPFDGYPMQAAFHNGNIALVSGVNGSPASTSPNPDRLLANGETVPDDAIILYGSNDAISSRALSTFQGGILAAIDKARALGVKNIYLGTVPPNGSLDAGKETLRQSYNDWVRAAPAGVTGIIDFDAVLRDPADETQCHPTLVSADEVHPLRAGYARMASIVPPGRRP